MTGFQGQQQPSLPRVAPLLLLLVPVAGHTVWPPRRGIMQHDESSGHLSTFADINDRPVTPVPVADDLRSAIQAFHTAFPNLGAGSVLSQMHRDGFPDATWDEIRTVLAEAEAVR